MVRGARFLSFGYPVQQITPPADAIRAATDLAAPSDPVLMRLFDYWNAKRGGRQMPRRADIDPIELRGLLPYVVLCDVVDPARLFRVRVIGQAIVDFIGVNITGRPVTDMMPPAAAKRMIEIASGVVATRSPQRPEPDLALRHGRVQAQLRPNNLRHSYPNSLRPQGEEGGTGRDAREG
jgi:hypothetical protein